MRKNLLLLAFWLFLYSGLTGQTIKTIAGNGVAGYSGDGGPATSAKLSRTCGVAVDNAGTIYFADVDNNRIRKIAVSGTITTVAGNGVAGYSGDGGLATSASLSSPCGVAIDKAGNIYFADSSNYRIRKITSSGIITTIAGNGINGIGGDGDDGLATIAQLNNPRGVAVDNIGNIFFVESNIRIRKISTSGIITTVAGIGKFGYSQDGVLATEAWLLDPNGLAVDNKGNIYFSEVSNRIRKVSSSGILNTIGGIGGMDAKGFSGDGGQATLAQMNNPRGIIVDSIGNVYFSDADNNRIRKIATSGIITTVAGNGGNIYMGDGLNSTSVALNYPNGMAIDASQNIFYGDVRNSAIRVMTPPGPSITSFVPSSGLAGSIATIFGSHFTGTSSVTFGGTAAASFTVMDSVITAIVGSGATGAIKVTNSSSSDTSKAIFTYYDVVAPTVTSFSPTYGVTGTSVTISGLNFTKASSVSFGGVEASLFTVSNDSTITAIVGAGSKGVIKVTNFVISGNSQTEFTYVAPIPTITSFSPTSGIKGTIVTISGYQFGGVTSVTFGGIAASSFTVSADSTTITAIMNSDTTGVIKVFNSANSCTSNTLFTYIPGPIIKTIAGNGTAGYSGDGGSAISSQIANPYGIAVDSTGNIYFADHENNRIRKIAVSGIITTIVGNGIKGFSGDGGLATSAQLQLPQGVAVDNAGNIYVVEGDSSNNRIRKVSKSGIITTVAGNGIKVFSGDGVLATAVQLSSDGGIAVDNIGNIYYADSHGSQIRKIASSGIITTIAGTGMAGFSGDGGLATAALLFNPTKVAVDNAGNIYFADLYNNRIRKVSKSGIITTIAGNAGNGTIPSRIDGVLATTSILYYPSGITVDSIGNIYIVDGCAIRKIATSGIITRVAGIEYYGYYGDGIEATSAILSPSGVAVDASGNVFIADGNNYRIRKVTISTKPSIKSFSPTSGIPGTSVTISGSHFTGISFVTFGGTSALSYKVTTDSTITAIVGSGASGVIKVTNYVDSDTSKTRFTCVAAIPTIKSFSPVSGTTGTSVTILGSQFTGTSSVTFGGIPATSFNVSNDSTITAIVRYGSTGIIKVINSINSDTSKTRFTFVAPTPIITSFSPTNGITGTSVAISGFNFTGISSVTFGGTAALSYIVSCDTSITAIVGSGATGVIKVADSVNYNTSKTEFTYYPVINPTITSFTPTSGVRGTVVTISGTHLRGTSAVSFGGIAASSFTVTSDSTITAIVGWSRGNCVIKVTNSANSDTSKINFTYNVSVIAPTVNSFTPNTGSYETNVTISGSHFTETSSVTFGGIAAYSYIVSNDSTISAVVEAGATGIIKVTNAANYDTSKTIFTYIPGPIITTIAGNGTWGYSGDGGPAISAQMTYPYGVAVDIAGNIYFADGANYRIRKIASSGIITTVAGNGRGSFSGDGGLATLAQLDYPSGVALDNRGNIYISDASNRIRKIASSGIITTIAGNGISGFSGDGGLATSAQLNPGDEVAIDTAGNIYLADNVSNRIRKIASSGIITTIAGNGIQGFNGDGGIATGAQLNNPRGVAIDKGGNIFFADLGNNRIRKISINGIITTIAGNGIQGFSGDGGLAIGAQLNYPNFITLDAMGNIYFTVNDNRIRKISTSGIITTVAGNGSYGYSGDGGQATAATFDDLNGVAVDASGNIFIADFNLRIRKVISPKPSITSFSPTIGTSGTSVTISGSHFIGTSSVTFGGISALSYTVSSDSTITAIVGSGATGVIKVTNYFNYDTSKTRFTYVAPVPTIKSFSPIVGLTGNIITILGSHFTGISSVTFGGTAVSSFTVSNDSTITAIVASGATGIIKVSNAANSDTSKTRFTYVAIVAPTIKSFTPGNGTTGTSVTIIGTHFTGTSSVKIGGIAAASFTVLNDSTLTAIVGTGATGFIEVIHNYLGDTSLNSFTYIPKPIPSINITSTLSSFKTCSGTVSPTQNFIISGSKITSPITILTSNNLEISSNQDSSYGSNLNLSSVTDTIGGTPIYIRLKSNSPAGIYTDTVLIASSGTSPKYIYLRDTINALPITQKIQNLNTLTFCSGGNVLLIDSLLNGNQWFLNDSAINGANSISYRVYVSGNYTVKVTSAAGCVGALSKVTTVKVNPNPVTNFNIGSACTGRFTDFKDSTSLSDGTQNSNVFNWNFGDGSTSTLKNPSHYYSSSTNYNVNLIVTSINGCRDTLNKELFINPLPRASFTASTIACSNIPVSFSDSGIANGSVITNWNWNFGDSLNNTNNSSQNTAHGYSYPGSYSVILFVTSDKGCKDSTTKTIVINASPSLPVVSPITTYCQGLQADSLTATLINGNSLLWYNQATGGNGSNTSPLPATSTIGETDFYVSQKNNSTSCESQRAVIAVNVNPYPVIPSITKSLNQLISSPSTYYKWYYYDSLMDNGTNDRINLLNKGLYKVTTSIDNICWSNSSEYLVQSNPTSITQKDYQLIVYPNPANGQFYIDIKLDAEYSGNMKFSMVNLMGTTSLVYQKYIFNSQRIKIPISFSLGNQVYILTVTINGYLTKTIKITGI